MFSRTVDDVEDPQLIADLMEIEPKTEVGEFGARQAIAIRASLVFIKQHRTTLTSL
jgi:hypothetical protein